MLRERFLIAKNTCGNFFPRFARTDRRFAPLSTRAYAERLRAPPSAVCYDSGPYHFFYAAAAPATPRSGSHHPRNGHPLVHGGRFMLL